MGKGGGGGVTNVTQTTTNPTTEAQLPYLKGGWQYASQVRDLGLDPLNAIRYYPGSTLANFNPAMSQAYGELINQGNYTLPIIDRAIGSTLDAATGGYQQSPARDLYMSIFGGANAPFGQVSGLQDAAVRALSATQPQSQGLLNIGAGSYNRVSPFSQGLYNIGGNSYNVVDPYADTLFGIAQGAGGNVAPYTGGLYAMAGSSVPSAMQYAPDAERAALYGTSAGAFDPNAGTDELTKAATGSYVGRNPYLTDAINAAIDPITRSYMTNVAPGIESRFTMGGRGGSGAELNASRQAAQDYERQVGNVSSTMSNAAYQAERAQQEAAAQQLATIRNTQRQIAQSGFGAAGQLGLGTGALDLNAIQQAISALTQGAGATTAAGTLASNAASNAGSLVNTAGQVGSGALAQGAGAENTAGQVGTGALDASGRMVNQGQALSQDALKSQASILDAIMGRQLQAAGGIQTGYDTGNRNAYAAMGLIPGMIGAAGTPLNLMLQGAGGYTQMEQQQIQDAMNRYYGTQNAPWETLSRYMNAIGQPTTGSSSTTTPNYYSPTANILGGISGGISALGGINNLTGGALGRGVGSLFGGGSGAGSLASSVFGADAPFIGGSSVFAGAGGSALSDLFPMAAASSLADYGAANAGWLGSLLFL